MKMRSQLGISLQQWPITCWACIFQSSYLLPAKKKLYLYSKFKVPFCAYFILPTNPTFRSKLV